MKSNVSHSHQLDSFKMKLMRVFTDSDIGTWRSIVELNFGTNQIQKLPDDIALLENLEV